MPSNSNFESNNSGVGEGGELTTSQELMVSLLLALAASGSGEFIRKTSATAFENATPDGTAITVKDEGIILTSGLTLLNFVGAGVTATGTNEVTVDYTDEGNTARTLTLPVAQLAGTFITAITNVTGAGPYEGVDLTVRVKAATNIVFKTAGVFTSVTYNVEAALLQIN